MAGGSLFDEATVTGSRAVALAFGVGFVLRFLKWLVEFTFSRLDVSRSQLGLRLRHVEQELDAYREATMLMIAVVAKLDPENVALAKVAHILRSITPRVTIELDELVDRLKDIPNKGKSDA
jgi:hypothetical protein